MGIISAIAKLYKETAVYWPSPNEDGYGNLLYGDPIELTPPNGVRWEDKDQLIRSDDGNQISSRAIVYVLQDIDMEGVMYLGSLDDLSAEEKSNPKLLDKASIVKKFEKSPVLGSTTEFYRKVWLTPLLT